ncbi:MAG: 2-oxoacid:acceptor oxidoreductase subunit alpha [Verrucomicrobiota bacterium]|jgi:2-oxoglutarate ferredoxin oxidoreductase subunit alpha
MSQDLIIGMAGSGGDGVVSAGESLITAAALEGYYGLFTKSFGSQIRGGEASCRLRLATRPVLNPNGPLDVAVALDWEDFRRFGSELPVEFSTVVIYDSNTGVPPGQLPLEGLTPAVVFSVPITDMAVQYAGTDRAKNIVVLGLLAGWFGIGRQSLQAGILKKFGKKGAAVVEANARAFQAGLDFADSHPLPSDRKLAPPQAVRRDMLLTDGNEMCAAAAIFAGCSFFAGYPITPSTEIMQFLDREIWKYGGTLLQAEDEIASIGAVVGASFAGKKAMTATSGPGMSLMTEMLGLATIAELPLVCVNVQRGGPATGIPTKAEQADLFQAALSAHGDCLRPVLAPSSVGDMFGITVEAFNLAEHYQTPVIVLSDQEISQRKEIVEPIATETFRLVERRRPTETELAGYARFKFTESGISPISHPGMLGGNYLAAGIEHNELGRPTAGGDMHARMNNKRFRKFNPLKNRRDLFEVEGDPDARIGLVSWGSVAGVARESLRLAQAEGLRAKLLVPKLLYPVAESVYQDFFASVTCGLFIEQSFQGQLYRLVRMYVDIPALVKPLARSGSNPIQPAEILQRLRQMVAALQGGPSSHPTEPADA